MSPRPLVASVFILIGLGLALGLPGNTTAGTPAFSSPPGRPPVGPLERYDPQLFDLEYEITIAALASGQRDPNTGAPLIPDHPEYDPNRVPQTEVVVLRDTPIMLPLIMQSTFSIIDQSTLQPKLWLGGVQQNDVSSYARIDESNLPYGTKLAVIPVRSFSGRNIRWSVSYRTQVWSSRIDDKAAGRIAWPREWPKEVRDGLKPQLYIQSDDPVFAETVERISDGNLRMVPPYYAAKDIVRYCIANVQLTGGALFRGAFGSLQGMYLNGALETARTGRGRPFDLPCVCVAMLRAANIPARPVVGIIEDENRVHVLHVWAEFWLPECGWIPFDPIQMRGTSFASKHVQDPWPEFGTIEDLGNRIPMSFHFLPPVQSQVPRLPAVWGWDPQGAIPDVDQHINIKVTSRGSGREDPK